MLQLFNRKSNNNKGNKTKSLSNKISIISATTLIALFIIITIFISINVQSSIKEILSEEFAVLSKSNGLQVQAIIDAASSSAGVLQDYMVDAYEKENIQTVEEENKTTNSIIFKNETVSQLNYEVERFMLGTMNSTVKNNEDIMGMGAFFEPYKFDKRIKNYSLYITAQDAENGNIQDYGAYENYSKEEYYSVAASTQKPFFTAPYKEQGVVMVSATYPVVFNGETMGVVLADVNVSNFSKIDFKDSDYPSMYATIYDENQVIVYDNESADDIMKNMADFMNEVEFNKIKDNMDKGEAFSIETVRSNGDKYTRFFYPINAEGSTWWAQTALLSSEMNSQLTKIILTLIISLIIVLIVIICTISTILKKSLNPIAKVVEAANNIVNGKLDVEIDVNSDDEIGMLSNAFRDMSSNLNAIITDINYMLHEMSEGNFVLNSTCEEKYVGEYQNIFYALNNINENLSDTLKQINVSSEQVSGGAEQVSYGAQALSQGATEQASSVEELSATIAQISEQINTNAKGTQEASGLSNEAGRGVLSSNEKMQEMILAMEEITEKSNEIGKIIKTIDDIAFQTNILALNAAVEAARAGSAGKGFAVVADEVRNLAQKSAEAAKNTTSLIEGTVNAVEKGSKIANETANSLLEVVEKAKRVNGMILDIASANEEQALATRQISQGIEQISAVVQNNSATAEESAAASEELSGQANMLKELVSKFNLRD